MKLEKQTHRQLQMRVMLASASLSLQLGHRRKAAFFLVESAQAYLDANYYEAAHEVPDGAL